MQGQAAPPPVQGATQRATTPAAQPSIDERRAALQEKLTQTQNRLAAFASAKPGDPLLPGVTADERASQQQLLHSLERVYENHLDSLRRLKEIVASQKELKEAAAAWRGFSEPPPYSVSFVDDLWDQVSNKDRQIGVVRVEQGMIDGLLEEARSTLKSSEQALRQSKERLEATDPGPAAARARWLTELAELRHSHDEAMVGGLETGRQVNTERLAYFLNEQELLQRKALAASRASPLSVQDRDAKLAALESEQRKLAAEIAQISKVEQTAIESLKSALAQLREAQEQLGRKLPQDETHTREIGRLRQELDTLNIEVDAAGSTLRMLRLLSHAVAVQQKMWEKRHRTENTNDTKVLDEALADVKQTLERRAEWRSYFGSQLDETRRRMTSLEQRFAAWRPEYGERSLAERELRAWEQQESVFRRVLAQVDSFDAVLRSWQEAMRLRKETATVAERLRGLAAEAAENAGKFWNFELLAVEDKIVVEGREIVGKRSVTLGKITKALLILLLGFWLAARIAAYGRRHVLARIPGKASTALLMYRLFSLFVIVGITVFALVSVNIPLTVFAFLGGALAIGVGFGAQNILNNFISGLILLAERPIKLGDIVEVEGVRGEITDIGARCCQVHRPDGIDMLVPNSSFLEKSVINWTLSSPQVRFTINVRVPYGSSTREAIGLIRRAAEEHPKILKHPTPEVLLLDVGESALTLAVYFWVDISREHKWREVVSDIRQRIEELFRHAGMQIAFPTKPPPGQPEPHPG